MIFITSSFFYSVNFYVQTKMFISTRSRSLPLVNVLQLLFARSDPSLTNRHHPLHCFISASWDFFWRPRFVFQLPPLLQSPHHANYVPLKICFGSSWLREFIEHKLLSPSQYLSSLPFLCHIMISLIIWKLVIILIIFNIFTGGFKNPHNHIFLLVGILIGPVWFMNL